MPGPHVNTCARGAWPFGAGARQPVAVASRVGGGAVAVAVVRFEGVSPTVVYHTVQAARQAVKECGTAASGVVGRVRPSASEVAERPGRGRGRGRRRGCRRRSVAGRCRGGVAAYNRGEAVLKRVPREVNGSGEDQELLCCPCTSPGALHSALHSSHQPPLHHHHQCLTRRGPQGRTAWQGSHGTCR